MSSSAMLSEPKVDVGENRLAPFGNTL